MMYKGNVLLLPLAVCLFISVQAQTIIADKPQTGLPAGQAGSAEIVTAGTSAIICIDRADFELIQRSAGWLQQDIEMVTGKKLFVANALPTSAKTIIIIGTVEKSSFIQQLVKTKKLNIDKIKNKWDAYLIQAIANPFKGINSAVVIAGGNKRGAAYATLELSKQIGVSPWYWWADVPVKKKNALYINAGKMITDAPKVKYRGIFINDEAPAFSGWTREKFGGFNHVMYEKMFELILRLKGNYLWPAMWGNAFYDDDSLNIKSADSFGIVIGTSHHEPLMRAHDEWRRYGKGKWDYDSNEVRLKEFWKAGMRRATNEKIVSVGMRGDGDQPMSRQTATALLERIVKDQRQIIEEVTGKPAAQTPQLWALYKEVQDYYDKGMRVPDDVTLLLCDDNWGNIRKLPKLNEKPRAGGYGIYYHFDYVGGPRNYKWVNTNPIARVWEQMHLAYEYGVRQIWIVNVGDLKPMEFPISFWLDYAWNPEKIGQNDLQKYTEQWAADQFGSKHAVAIADIISKYTKYNGRRKPELLDANTYSILNYDEAGRVTKDWNDLLTKAEHINNDLPPEYRDAYFELVLHPVRACSNLQHLYTQVAWNRYEASRNSPVANRNADAAKRFYNNDSVISAQYHAVAAGKWNHMMDQTHIGYTYWQQPPRQRMPEVKYVPADSIQEPPPEHEMLLLSASEMVPKEYKGNVFYEEEGYVSIEADHFTKAIHSNGITWTILPDHGKTGSAVTPFPVTAAEQKPGGSSPHLQYEVYVYDTGTLKLNAYFSPTLNFYNTEKGLQYALSIDDEAPQLLSINSEDRNTGAGIWNNWVSNNIIIKTTNHRIVKPGKHVIKFWMVNPCVVLQKLVMDFGGVKPSYLGPPETKKK
jgi:hypothetical protein